MSGLAKRMAGLSFETLSFAASVCPTLESILNGTVVMSQEPLQSIVRLRNLLHLSPKVQKPRTFPAFYFLPLFFLQAPVYLLINLPLTDGITVVAEVYGWRRTNTLVSYLQKDEAYLQTVFEILRGSMKGEFDGEEHSRNPM